MRTNMNTITLRAHFDGEKIVLDEPFDLEPNTQLVVMVVPDGQLDQEREDWANLAMESLARAYGDDEPDYDTVEIKVANPYYDPKYEGR